MPFKGAKEQEPIIYVLEQSSVKYRMATPEGEHLIKF